MSLMPKTIENLASMGANIEIMDGEEFLPHTLENVVRICVESGGHVTINVDGLLPHTLETLAEVGGNSITFRV